MLPYESSTYNKAIRKWQSTVDSEGVTLSDGKPITEMFWKTFLGLSRTTHLEFMNGTAKRATLPPAIVRSITFINLLTRDKFLEAVIDCIPAYEDNKRG